MIIREIKKRPFEVVGNFDWFNDYDDTRQWAKSACDAETVALLDAGFALWLKRRNMPKEIVLELDAEVLEAAKKIAVERNTDISGLVTQLLEEELGK